MILKKFISCLFVSKWIHYSMYLIQRTDQFDKWLKKLRDVRAKAKILARLKTVELGNLGDYKSIRSKLYEL